MGESRSKQAYRVLPLLLLAVLIVAACTSSGGDPAKVVEQYLQAKVAADQTTLRGLLCSSMEDDLQREATSFAGLDAKLVGVSCQVKSGSTDVVTCAGQIVATYGTEQTSFPLTSYKVVQEDDQWKWCGEAP